MIANRDDSDNPEDSLQDELRDFVEGLREEVQALRDEVKALRRKDAPNGPDALLPREEAAERLGISTRTLDAMEEAGEIQAVRIRGRVLYAPETLQAYIRRRAGEGRSMNSSVRTDLETAPSETDVEALYDDLFGTPALDTVEQETEERDQFDVYAAVYEVAKQFPAVARKAARDGTSAHYRGAAPFDYSVGEPRRCGEVENGN